MTGKKAIPVIGLILNRAQTIRDYKNTPEDYSKCIGGDEWETTHP